jgi:short-subunit dehydrogenase
MKKILIIGATSAIANACARHWVTQFENTQFFLVARNADKLAQIAADIATRGAIGVHSYVLNIADSNAHNSMLQEAILDLEHIDIALIAHGVLPDQTACEQDVSLAINEFTINATATISLLTLLARQLEAQRKGTLAVITSVAGDRGRVSNYLYASAKAAVSTFCEGLRARLFKVGVHVIDIRPGFVDTPMTAHLPLPAALVAKPDAVAKHIVTGIKRKHNVLYTPSFWFLIMFIIRSIPNFIFKKMKL